MTSKGARASASRDERASRTTFGRCPQWTTYERGVQPDADDPIANEAKPPTSGSAHDSGGAALHLIRRNVLDVGRDVPAVPEWVVEHRDTVAVEVVLRFLDGLGACLGGPLEDVIDVLDVDEQRHRRPAEVFGLGSVPPGISSPIMITEPSSSSSAWATVPSGMPMRIRSVAQNTLA